MDEVIAIEKVQLKMKITDMEGNESEAQVDVTELFGGDKTEVVINEVMLKAVQAIAGKAMMDLGAEVKEESLIQLVH